MSYDIALVGTECPVCGRHDQQADWDPTYNYYPMFVRAFKDDRGIRVLDGLTGAEAEPLLRGAVADMERHPDDYRALDASNNWGTYDQGIVDVLKEMAEACERNPNAKMSVR